MLKRRERRNVVRSGFLNGSEGRGRINLEKGESGGELWGSYGYFSNIFVPKISDEGLKSNFFYFTDT